MNRDLFLAEPPWKAKKKKSEILLKAHQYITPCKQQHKEGEQKERKCHLKYCTKFFCEI